MPDVLSTDIAGRIKNVNLATMQAFTLKGNNRDVTGDPRNLTASQLAPMLDYNSILTDGTNILFDSQGNVLGGY